MLGLRLSVLLLGAPADLPAPPEPAPASPSSGRVVGRVWLRGAGLDADALAEAVATRLTDKQILAAGQAAGPIEGLVALCHVTAQGGQLVLEVILGDGRVYQRKIAAPAAGRERTAARLIAATLASIEDETARPDRSDGVFVAPAAASPEAVRGPAATMPTAVPDPGAASPDVAGPVAAGPASVSAGSPASATRPVAGRPASVSAVRPASATRAVPARPASVSAVSPATRPGAAEPRVDVRAPATTPAAMTAGPRHGASATRASARALELGVALELGAGFGLGAPSAGAGLAGGGGGVRIDLKLRRSLLLGAGFRGHTRLRDGLALGRFRGAVMIGHLLRRGAFELTTLVGPTLETWQVTQDGAPVKYTTTSSTGASLLLGGLARVGLGGRVQRDRVSARIGGYVELASSARSSGRVPQIARAAGEAPVFVLGGAELSVGVEVALWFALRRGR